jgi:hypothetical protein
MSNVDVAVVRLRSMNIVMEELAFKTKLFVKNRALEFALPVKSTAPNPFCAPGV